MDTILPALWPDVHEDSTDAIFYSFYACPWA